MFFEPENLIESLLPVLPALVGIHGDRQVRDLADGLNHLLVVVESDLDFQDIELVGAFPCLLPHDLRSVDADRECGVRRLPGIEAPDPVPRHAHQFAHKVVQGNVHGSFRGGVALGERIDVRQDLVDAERVIEYAQVHLAQECRDTFHGLSQIRRHRGFAVARESVIFNLHLHVRGGFP